MTATYPGADDSPITVEDSVRFLFFDYEFAYYWHNGEGFDTSAAGSGVYFLGTGIEFSNEIMPDTNPPLTINGIFDLQISRDTMILSQGGTPDIDSLFKTIYVIRLIQSYAMPYMLSGPDRKISSVAFKE
jgi:hypothetical protein